MPHIPRLTHLVHMLEALPSTLGFDLTTFVTTVHGCGTTACAMGYAALDPTFMAEGFRLTVFEDASDARDPTKVIRHIESVEDFNNAEISGPQWMSPSFGTWRGGTQACRKFFEISIEDFDRHFTEYPYPNKAKTIPAEVAARLRASYGIVG